MLLTGCSARAREHGSGGWLAVRSIEAHFYAQARSGHRVSVFFLRWCLPLTDIFRLENNVDRRTSGGARTWAAGARIASSTITLPSWVRHLAGRDDHGVFR